MRTVFQKKSDFINKKKVITFIICGLISATSLSRDNENVTMDYEKALISYQKLDIQASIIHLKNALQQDEKHTPSRLLLAKLYIELGDGVSAEIELLKAQAGNADRESLVTLFANAYLLQSKFDKVIEVTKPGVRNTNIEAELLVFKGQALIGQKLYRSADVAFSEALAISPNNQMALLGRAQMAMNEQKLERALYFVNKALTSAKPFVNGWILKSNIYNQKGELKESMKAINKALEIDSSHMLAHLYKAMLHINFYEYSLAESHVDFILADIPNEPRAGYLKALINASLQNSQDESGTKKLTEVVATLSAVSDDIMKNTPDYYYLAGLTNFQIGNFEDARRYLEKYMSYEEFHLESVRMIAVIDLQQGHAISARNLLSKTNIARPNNPNILTLLGMAYLQLKETNKAEAFFKEVLNIFPNSEIGITNLARTKMQSGQYKSAIDALISIKDNEVNKVQIKLLLIDSYEKSGEISKAIDIAKELTSEFPNDSYFYQRIGTLYGLSKDLEKARSSFSKSIELDDKNIASIVHLARMDIISGEVTKARKFLLTELIRFENNSFIMSEISDSYLSEKDNESALSWIKKAYSQNLNDFYVLSKLVNVLVENDAIGEAIDTCDLFIGQNPKTIEALPLLASLYQLDNKDQQAILALRDYVKKSDNQSRAYGKLAKAQIQAGERLGAIQSYKKAIIVDDTFLPSYIGLVNLIIASKNEPYALNLIDKIYKLSGSESIVRVLKGDLYSQLDKPNVAIKHYLKALSISDQKQALLGIYNTYKRQQNAKDAIPYINKWLKKYPDDLAIEIALADSYRYSRQFKESVERYDALLTKYGALPILLNNAANVNYLYGKHDKAKSYAQQAYNYVKDNVAIMDTLAWIESRMGNHEKALGLFRNALTQDFDNAEIKYHLAITLKQMGRDGEAKNYLIEAIDSNQKFSDKDKAKELLNTWL